MRHDWVEVGGACVGQPCPQSAVRAGPCEVLGVDVSVMNAKGVPRGMCSRPDTGVGWLRGSVASQVAPMSPHLTRVTLARPVDAGTGRAVDSGGRPSPWAHACPWACFRVGFSEPGCCERFSRVNSCGVPRGFPRVCCCHPGLAAVGALDQLPHPFPGNEWSTLKTCCPGHCRSHCLCHGALWWRDVIVTACWQVLFPLSLPSPWLGCVG